MYRPGKLIRRPPTLLHTPCERKILLDTAWRRDNGQTQKICVEDWFEGTVFVDVDAVEGSGSLLWPVVEIGWDTCRWADHRRGQQITAPGYYRISVRNLCAYLRVSYVVQGAVKFGIDWIGKGLKVGGAQGGLQDGLHPGPRPGHAHN